MKFISLFSFLIAFTIYQPTSHAQIGKFLEKKVREGKKNKEEKEEEAEEEKPEKSSTENTSNPTSQAAAGAELDYSAGDPYWSFSTLFEGLKINKETGDLSLDGISVFNMPEKDVSGKEVNYYSEQNVQFIVSQVDLNGAVKKEVGKTKVIPSPSRGLAYMDPENSTIPITEPGYYRLVLNVNGKEKESLRFLVRKGTKDGVTRYYLSDPWGKMGNLKIKEPGNEEFFQLQFEILHAEQNLAANANADGKDVVAKLYNDDTEEVLAISPNNSGGIYSKQEWKTHNLKFFEDAEGYHIFKAANLLKTDGNYSIRMRTGVDENFDTKYVYQFSVNNGQIVAREGSKIQYDKKIFNGLQTVWIEGQTVGSIKIDGVQQPLAHSGMKENLGFMYHTDGQSRGCRPPDNCSISDGDVFGLLDLRLPKEIQADTKLKDVTVILSLMNGNEVIAQNAWEESCGTDGCTYDMSIAIVPKLDVYGYNNQTVEYAKALAGLPAGNHNLKFVAEVQYGKDTRKVFGLRKFTYKSTAGNPKYTAMIPELEKRLSMTEDELSAEHWEKFGGPDPVTLVNNCGRTVWLRNTSSEAEVYIGPGKKYTYDRNEGYLEQWNFGTMRWKIISHVFKVSRDEEVNICN